MNETHNKNGNKSVKTATISIPVWVGGVGLFVLIVFFVYALSINGKNRAINKEIRLTATRMWMEEELTMTKSVMNEQAPATQTALPTTTPSPTITTPSPTPSPTPSLEAGSARISSVDGMTMLFVPEGTFPMGYEGGDTSNKPVHEVYLDAYWIDQTEISNGMYAECVSAGKCTAPMKTISINTANYYGNPVHNDDPVINVTWFQANEYCNWVGRKLPTEAQWEKAARGDDGRMYPWGDKFVEDFGNLNPVANGLLPVGSYASGASPYGALQMAGNVYEWVADWYDKDYYRVPDNSQNPTGPTEGSLRSVRGGYYKKTINPPMSVLRRALEGPTGGYVKPVTFLSGYRFSLKPVAFSILVGFRCAAGNQ